MYCSCKSVNTKQETRNLKVVLNYYLNLADSRRVAAADVWCAANYNWPTVYSFNNNNSDKKYKPVSGIYVGHIQ